jgi:hypothetical protein
MLISNYGEEKKEFYWYPILSSKVMQASIQGSLFQNP